MTLPTQHNLFALKATTHSKNIESKISSDRQRDILILIHSYLHTHGYIQAATQLQNEAGKVISSRKFECADNIDLLQIVAEYEAYNLLRFGTKPKFSRRVANVDKGRKKQGSQDTPVTEESKKGRRRNKNSASVSVRRSNDQQQDIADLSNPNKGENGSLSSVNGVNMLLPPMKKTSKGKKLVNSIGMGEKEEGESCTYENDDNGNYVSQHPPLHQSNVVTDLEDKIIKPLPSFGGQDELRSLAATIQREILDSSLKVSWNDIIELDHAKQLLKEAVVMPLQYPELFSGLLVPWRGILLYGPPGTGKTLLAKAVATQSQTTFFNISGSSIVSKYRGESEKLIKVLFELARYHSPSTIFMDEIDSIMGHRGGGSASSSMGEGSEHEGSRRMKTELLVEMDGIGNGSEHVFVLAASNLPWDLDPALLRRLEKRILVPMPGKVARKRMLEFYLSQHVCNLEDKDYDECATMSEGYSGADIKLICKEAAMRPVRSILKQLDSIDVNANKVTNNGRMTNVKSIMKSNPIKAGDLQESLTCTKPSSGAKLHARYDEWSKEHGSL